MESIDKRDQKTLSYHNLPSNNCPQDVNMNKLESFFVSKVACKSCRSSDVRFGCCCCRCCFSEIRTSFECLDSRQLSGFNSESFDSFEWLEFWLLTVESSAIVASSMIFFRVNCAWLTFTIIILYPAAIIILSLLTVRNNFSSVISSVCFIRGSK